MNLFWSTTMGLYFITQALANTWHGLTDRMRESYVNRLVSGATPQPPTSGGIWPLTKVAAWWQAAYEKREADYRYAYQVWKVDNPKSEVTFEEWVEWVVARDEDDDIRLFS